MSGSRLPLSPACVNYNVFLTDNHQSVEEVQPFHWFPDEGFMRFYSNQIRTCASSNRAKGAGDDLSSSAPFVMRPACCLHPACSRHSPFSDVHGQICMLPTRLCCAGNGWPLWNFTVWPPVCAERHPNILTEVPL